MSNNNNIAALDSPVEALALNYLIHAANAVWALIAVVTAALSFWGIRAFSSPPPPQILSLGQPVAVETPSPPPAVVSTAAPADRSETQQISSAAPTKTKFSLYYEEDEFRENDDDGDYCDGGDDGVAAEERWCDEWERTMAVRMGDLGWYRWQDTAVLDGSVVRLWAAETCGGGGAWRRRVVDS